MGAGGRAIAEVFLVEFAAWARRLARLASASKPSGLRLLSGSEWSFGELGGTIWGREEEDEKVAATGTAAGGDGG
jgi:hypothetical protein